MKLFTCRIPLSLLAGLLYTSTHGCASTNHTDAVLDAAADAAPDGTDLRDATERRDAMPVGPQPNFVGFWGGFGREPGQFVEPSSVEMDSEGLVYVAGHENRFQKFTQDGSLLSIIGSAGTADGEFNHPHGLAVDRRRGDLVYVGDQENNRLQVYSNEGVFVRAWGDEGFTHIHDVGIDPRRATFSSGISKATPFASSPRLGIYAQRMEGRVADLGSSMAFGGFPLIRRAMFTSPIRTTEGFRC